ncbi:presequence protease, mitochondrial [Oratosquilla oratoria]|uniref:presequence protease, mitochondrial n=1 Tax=Oratosquilla oratoria TaxID=337810 RepID=UPI003F76E581
MSYLRLITKTLRNGRPTFRKCMQFRSAASTAGEAAKADFPVGEEVSGFVVEDTRDIPELHMTTVRLRHVRTGADYLHIARDDPNNVFCVGFRTTPMDSTGVPHILEHSVLCGSKNYPCRDPFFKMLNRSLSTFMNAMTGCDYTIYPFSTQNPVDFRNLMSVYLDAVFSPRLDELDFLQEGWRLEHEDPQDRSSGIVLKGVVFNEMKGVFADSQRLFMQKVQNDLLPYHTYGVVSGGDPLSIPELTWHQLRAFHADHYHPSNSRFFTYGDQPLADHLSFIHDKYLSQYAKIEPKTEVPNEPRWSVPRTSHVACAMDPMTPAESQTSVAVSYLLSSITDTFETFVLQILGELLMGGPNAPFYKTLLETQLGSNFSPVAGFDSHTRDTTFTMGLQGVKVDDVKSVLSIIDQTFDQVIEEGFSAERVEAVLHSVELAMKHQSASFGLGIAMALTPLWNHDGNPVDALEINKSITRFRACLRDDPQFLQKKVEKYFKNNGHKLTTTMAPKEGYEEGLQEEEKKLLSRKLETLTEEDKEKIWNLGHALAKKQEETEDLSCLPTLKLEDIPREITPRLVLQEQVKGVPVQMSPQPTNGVTYFSTVLDTHSLPSSLKPLVPLFCGVLTRMGAGNLDYRALDQKAELTTGGLSADAHMVGHPIDVNQYEEGVLLRSHCLNQNVPAMLDLWSSIFTSVSLEDRSRFSSLVRIMATDLANSLVYSGHSFAMTAAGATTGHVPALKETWSGLTFVQQMKALSENDDLDQVLVHLQELASLVLNKERMRIAVNTNPENSDAAMGHVGAFLGTLPGHPQPEAGALASIPHDATPHTCRVHKVFPFPVNFASKSYSTVPFCHPDASALAVLAKLMFKFLHREIREKGGAYGGGAVAGSGSFSFYSYRDPHSTQTLANFDRAVDWVLGGNFEEQDVSEAKLGVFQKLDAPVSPGSRGQRLFQSHISDAMFADYRRDVLQVAPQDLVRVARQYLKEASVEGACLIGPPNELIANDPFWTTEQQ